METTITEAQLKDIGSGAGRIDEYRSMVNYETGTNKGYVRFSVDDHGKFTVQKFNNKVDVPLSLRHNTSATHNKTVREKFAQALESDMRFMDSSDRDEINNMILRPKVENKAKNGQAVDQGKALSRRDVKAVFDKFDKQFNTLLGRKSILSNFFREALKETRYEKKFSGDFVFSDDFVHEYLAPIDPDIEAKLKACLDVGDPEVPAKDPRKTMKMNESEFRTVLHQLGQVMDQFKIRQKVSDAVKAIAVAASEKADSFGVSLSDEDVSKVRAALSAAFKASNVEDVNLGFAQRGIGLELFIKTVLPVMVRQAAENIRDFGGDGKEPYEIAEGGLSFGEIFETARRFVDCANDIVAAVKDAKLPEGDEAKTMLGALAEVQKKARQTLDSTRVFMQARQELALNTALPENLRDQLARETGSLTKEFVVQAKLEEFAAKFVRENFTKAALDIPVQPTDFKKKAREYINNMVLAGQLNYGERWAVPDPTQKTGVRVYQGRDVQYFLTKVSDGAIELTNSLEGGMTMIEQLHVRTIPNIVNRKIHNAVASEGAARPNLGDDAVKDALNTIEVFGNAYMNFRSNRAGTLFGSTKKAFTSQLGRLLRNGSINQKEFNELSDDCDRRLKSALDRAIERFFDSDPFKKDDVSNIVARAEQRLENLFLEEKGKLVGEMNRMFATVAAMKAVKFDDRVNLLNSTLHINNFLNDIKKKDNNQPVLKGGFVGETGLVEVLDKLYFSVLADALKNVEPGNPPKNLTDSVKKEFIAAAKGLIEKVNNFSVKLDKLLKKFVDGGVDTAFKVNGFGYYSSDLGEDELTGVKKAISADVVLSLKYSADEAKRRMLFNHEIYANKREVSDFVDDLFRMVDSDNLYDSEKNIALVYKSVLDERVSAVNSWINTPTESNVKLSDDLAAGAKSRVLGEGRAAKSSAEAIEKGELDGIVKVAVGEVLARAQRFALSYSMGGRGAFMARVNAEVDTRVKQLVTDFAKFRADIVGKTDEMIPIYAAALDRVVRQQENRDAAPGENLEKIRKIRQEFLLELCNKSELLLELCNKSELPSTTKFLEVFVEKVEGTVKGPLVKEAMEHVRLATKAWEKCMPWFEKGVRGYYGILRDSGASKGHIEFLENTLMPVMRNNLQARIEQDVKKYADDEDGDIACTEGSKLAAEMADRILALDISKIDISKIDISKSDSFKAMLQDLGFNALSLDDNLCDIAKTAMKSVLDRDPGKALLEKAKAAAMMIVAYGEDSQDTVVADAKKGIEEYNTFLRQALVGYQAMAINDKFNEEELNPAKALFKGWVQRYGLSNLFVQSRTYGKGKFEDVAMNMFDMRIANAKKQIAETGKSDPLINGEFIQNFMTFLNESVIPELGDWDQSTRHNAFVKEIINKNAIAYKYLPPDVKDPYAETISDIVRLNVEGIYKVVDVAIKRAANVAKNLTLTVEDFSRFKKVIDDLYENEMKKIANNIENYNSFARTRVEMVKVMYTDEVSGTSAIKGYLKDAIKEQYKLDNVTDESLADGEIAKTYVHLQKVLFDFVGSHQKEMLELARSNVKPGKTYEEIGKNDFYSAKELKAIYRKEAKAIVEEIANAGIFAADRPHRNALLDWSKKMK